MDRDSYILAIGIDTYPGPIYDPLGNASGDAKRITGLLISRYGFQAVCPPIVNREATHENILQALNDLSTFIGKEDNLIIYFAGHGNKMPTSDNGYWVPVDEGERLAHRIYNSTVLDLIEGIDAKHIILVSDSCFSGTFLMRDRSSTVETDHDHLDGLKSGWILVSGGLETVGDGAGDRGSTFNQTLCELLEKNSRPSWAAGDLFNEVIRIMDERTLQHAGASPIRRPAIHHGGQMIFRLKSADSGDLPRAYEIPVFTLPETPLPANYLPRTLTYYSHQRPAMSWFYEPEVGQVYLKELIITQNRIVILGGAGSGKSIELIKAMESLQTANAGWVPIYRRLNNYTDEDIETYLPQGWEKADPATLVILLDGLDEIQPRFISTALRKIGSFADRFPQARILVSCRSNFYELPDKSFNGTLSGFSVYLLNDISIAEIRDHISTVYQIEADDFIGAVKDKGYLDIIQKPYFLNILTSYYKQNHQLDAGRATIMQDALERYNAANKAQYHSSDLPVEINRLLPIQEKIAFVMELMGKNFITDAELQELLPDGATYAACRYLPAFKYDQEKAQWYFEHNNIQEYLASRVLSRQPFDKMMEALTLSSDGQQKLKQTWTNTLSFLFSIGQAAEIKPIIDWLVANDPEVLVRFEPDRLTKEVRMTIFKQIVEFYREKQVWISSNKFSDKDLARFGHYEEILVYLLEIIESNSATRIDILNAVHLLYRFDISDFGQYRDRIKHILLMLMDREDFNNSDRHSVMGALSGLKINDEETIDALLHRYGKRENQYLRAGLYRLVGNSAHLDKYADLFLEGLAYNHFNYQSEDRSSVTLMDESHQLKAAVEHFTTPGAIRKLLNVAGRDINEAHLFFADYKENFEKILDHIFAAYAQDKSLFVPIVTFFARHATEQQKNYIPAFTRFFDEHRIRWEALWFLLNLDGLRPYEKNAAIAELFDHEMIDRLLDQHQKGTVALTTIEEIYKQFKWRGDYRDDYKDLLAYFKMQLTEKTQLTLQNEPEIDGARLFQEKAQAGFDLLFDRDAFKNEVESIFDYFEKDFITAEDLHGYKNGEYVDLQERFSSASADLFREFTFRSSGVARETILQWMDTSPQFTQLRIQMIKNRLSGIPELVISSVQQAFINDWVSGHGVADDYVWYFANKFNIALPREILLAFTRHYSPSHESKVAETGFIELLAPFLHQSDIREQVLVNLDEYKEDLLIWLANAGYALRNGIKEAYPLILDYLEAAHEQEYKFSDLLKLWFKKTGDIERLQQLAGRTASENLKETALLILTNSGAADDFLMGYYYHEVGRDGINESEKLEAYNNLLKLGVIDGFYRITDIFLENPKPSFDFRQHFRQISKLTNPEVIPVLIKLLAIAKQPEYKNDVFNDPESILLDAFFEIGIQSAANFKLVKEALLKFIDDHTGQIQNVNFLLFTITRIEDQHNLNLSRELSIRDAAAVFSNLPNQSG